MGMRPLLAVLLLAATLLGEILPSFFTDDVAWGATHIVVATEGETIDGKFKVLESLEGDLKVGAALTVPELAVFKDPKRRVIHEGFRPSQQVTSRRVLLFLKRTADGWKPATTWGDMDVSAAWVENGEAYALVQVLNPGPRQMTNVGTEKAMRQRIGVVRAAHDKLAKAKAIEDPRKSAEALALLVGSPVPAASAAAVETLGTCGEAALPVIERLLDNAELYQHHGNLVRELGNAGQKAAGPRLLRILKAELAFWKKTGPNLPVGWWNGTGADPNEVMRLRYRYGRTLGTINAIVGVDHRPAAETTKELADFWRSLPQLHDKSGIDQMTKNADAAYKALKGD